jgi:hypothetical protein
VCWVHNGHDWDYYMTWGPESGTWDTDEERV